MIYTDDQESQVSELDMVWSSDGEHGTWKRITIGRCPFCRKSSALGIGEVELEHKRSEDWPSQVQCGDCGAAGPWAMTEEKAIERWNNATGTETRVIAARPHVPHDPREEPGVDLPF
jgi:hypothetical protein